jgi:hypothetical protein
LEVGSLWFGPGDGLAFKVNAAGRIALSDDEWNELPGLTPRRGAQGADALVEEQAFLRGAGKVMGAIGGRFYVNHRSQAFAPHPSGDRYLGPCRIELMFEDPCQSDDVAQLAQLEDAERTGCELEILYHSARDARLRYLIVKVERLEKIGPDQEAGCIVRECSSGERLSLRCRRVLRMTRRSGG